jgi:hypothetical protein
MKAITGNQNFIFSKAVLVAVLLFGYVVGNSQTIGDFRSKQSGNWNDINTWEQWNGIDWGTPQAGSGFPSVVGTSVSVSDAATTHTVNLPAGGQVGDLLIMLWTDNGTHAAPLLGADLSTWTVLYDDNSLNNRRAAYYKIATGAEGISITITTSLKESSVHNVYRIAADTWQGVPEVSGLSTSTTATPNPPVFNPSGWTSDPTMWLISNHIAGDGGIAITAPVNYTGTLIRSGTGGGGGGGDALMASAYRFLNAESEDPGAFTNAQSRSTTASTIAIRGKQVSYYPKTIFPVVAATSSSAQTGDTKNHIVMLPAGVSKGDLLLIFYADKSNPSTVTTSGWTLLYDQTDATSVGIRKSAYYRIADGTEGVSTEFVTSNNERSAHVAYRILAGTFQGIPISGTVALSTTDNSAPNPPSQNPGWGAKNILWIAAAHSTGDDNTPTPAAPVSYENLVTGYSGNNGTGHARVVTAQRELASEVEDPGVFALGSSVAWFANTIAIQGSGYATVLNSHEVTTTENVSVPGVKINAGGTVLLNNGVAFTTPAGGSFSVSGILKTGTDGTALHSGGGTFALNDDGTLWVSSINGVTKSTALGNIQVSGTRTYHPNANYHYNGTQDQETGDAISTANNFTVSGGSNKSLTLSLAISGTLNLIAGDLNTGANNLLTIANGGDITGFKNESLIIGSLRRIGTGIFPYKVVFPLAGNKHKYLQLITITYRGPSDVDEFTITHRDTKHPSSNNKSTAISLVSELEYWDISPNAATRAKVQTINQGITLAITYKSDALNYIPDRSKNYYVLGHFNATAADPVWELASSDPTVLREGTDADGVITMYDVRNFSAYGIASTEGTTPVMLTKFNARITPEKKVELKWTTDIESVNKGFGIERQWNGIGKFEHIGFLHSQTADGNSSGQLHYTFVDQDPLHGATSYYRLAQLDLDGKLTYSEVRWIRIGNNKQTIIYPNPSNGAITIKRTEMGVKMNVQVIHSSGRVVQQYYGILESSFRLYIDQPGLYNILTRFPESGEEATNWVIVQ